MAEGGKANERWRNILIWAVAAIFILGIPSLPHREWHPAYWVAALVVEAALIFLLRRVLP